MLSRLIWICLLAIHTVICQTQRARSTPPAGSSTPTEPALPGIQDLLAFSPLSMLLMAGNNPWLRMWMMYRSMMMQPYGGWGWGDDGYEFFDD